MHNLAFTRNKTLYFSALKSAMTSRNSSNFWRVSLNLSFTVLMYASAYVSFGVAIFREKESSLLPREEINKRYNSFSSNNRSYDVVQHWDIIIFTTLEKWKTYINHASSEKEIKNLYIFKESNFFFNTSKNQT